MPKLKLDPLDTFADAGGTLIGRLLLFFAAGWVGSIFARVALAFGTWSDFLNPIDALRSEIADVWFELLIAVLWPFGLVLIATEAACVLGIITLVLIAASFICFILEDGSQPLLWLGIVLLTSAVALLAFDWSAPPIPGLLLLGIFWFGLGAAAWWIVQVQHPAWLDRVSDIFQGRPRAKAPIATPRKVSPEVWGKPVEGWESEGKEEDDDEEEAHRDS